MGQPWGEMPTAGRTLKKFEEVGQPWGEDAYSWTHVEKFEEVGQPWGEMPTAGRTLKSSKRWASLVARWLQLDAR